MRSLGSKLVLGSANFGLDYGLSNRVGRITQAELEKILTQADLMGINIIDTAQAYGDSEARIGSLNTAQFKIITKIVIDLDESDDADNLARLVKQSCDRLGQPRLYAVMLHRPEVLLGNYGLKIVNQLQALKTENIVSKIGVSIYSPGILKEISKLLGLDIVQAPFNIFDQRILSSGWAYKLKDSGVEIHTRSAFLQGLLLMQRSRLPSHFARNWPELFNSWFDFLNCNDNDALTTALGFVFKHRWIDKVVVGVDRAEHLKSLAKIEKSCVSISYPCLRCDDENLIDPSKWKLT